VGFAPRGEETWIGRLMGGRYRLDERLGQGVLATVYRATEQPGSARTCALKVADAPLPGGDDWLERESQLLARLDGVAAARPYAFARDDGPAWLAMELLPGRPLKGRLGAGPLTPREVARLGRAAAEALARLHARGVVHRDVKPSNLLEGPRGVILIDFGAAAESGEATGTLPLGTPAYAAPEQALGAPADPCGDLYALGVILFELAAGHHPFAGDPVERLVAHADRRPPLPRPPAARPAPALEALILALLDKQPSARPSAGAVVEALAALTEPEANAR
jgi:serine/threonine-protein kinase